MKKNTFKPSEISTNFAGTLRFIKERTVYPEMEAGSLQKEKNDALKKLAELKANKLLRDNQKVLFEIEKARKGEIVKRLIDVGKLFLLLLLWLAFVAIVMTINAKFNK